MEYKIGQIFEIDGIWYQFVEDNNEGCGNCVFYRGKSKCFNPDEDVKCAKWIREDGRNGHFVRLLPIGDMYEQGGETWQQYKCVDKPNTEDKRVYISYTDSDIGLIISVRLTENDDLNLIERKIGEIFEHNGEWYQCVEQPEKYDKTVCALCAFQGNGNCELDMCSGTYRSDKKSVIFKKLEKVGGPYADYCPSAEIIYFQRYKCYQKPIYNGDFICCPDDNFISIEIKNKEDMKTVKISKDDFNFLVNKIRYGILPKHIDYDKITNEISKLFSIDNIEDSNSENIEKNLKPFDLKAAKAGKSVCTRDGKKARIICFDRKGDICPIIALIEENGMEVTKSYDDNGRANYKNADNYDLMMLPEKKEGWVNVYTNRIGGPYTSREYAIRQRMGDCIDTVKIQWEE